MTKTSAWRLDCGDRVVLAPGRWFWLRTVSWTAGLFAFVVLAFFATLMLRSWLGLPRWTAYPIAILVPAATLGLYALAVRFGERRLPSELSLVGTFPKIIAGVAVGFAFMALSLAILWGLGLNTVVAGHWRDPFFYFVFNAYISAVLEELAFRAILLRLLARMFGPMVGLIGSAILFALAHASHAPPAAAVLLIVNGGLLLGVLYLVTGSLWAPIAAHLAYDFTEWSLLGVGDKDGFLQVTPSGHAPVWLTGGSFGPDGSILSAIASLSLIALVLRFGRLTTSRSASHAD